MNLLFFSLGAVIGAPLRYWLDQRFRSRHQFPTGIFIANIIGSFVIGFIYNAADQPLTFAVLGFCGALTTWSTFMLDLFLGYETRRFKTTALNLALSLAVGFLAVQTSTYFMS